MRLDHIAYRVKNRHKTAKFLEDALGYKVGTEFQIEFDDKSTADCLALVPPEERPACPSLWRRFNVMPIDANRQGSFEFHASPEIFVSDGPDGSIVGDWVKERGGIGGVHHMAYEVSDVKETMEKWKQKGYAEFYSDKPMSCPGLVQVFTKPSELTGIIYELITREGEGFCKDNVKALMESTKNV